MGDASLSGYDRQREMVSPGFSAVLNGKAFQTVVEELYGAEAPRNLARISDLAEYFRKSFDYAPSATAKLISVPGRIEVIGNHTDHQRGEVITASIAQDTLGLVMPTYDGQIRIRSKGAEWNGWHDFHIGYSNSYELDERKPSLVRLTKGILDYLSRLEDTDPEQAVQISGFDLVIASDVLQGSGLSSSASVGMLIGGVVECLQGKPIPLATLANASRHAENKYWKKDSGLMDQFGCAYGGPISIDFSDPEIPKVEPINLNLSDYGYSIVLVHTHASHAEFSHEYSSIPSDMSFIARRLGKKVLSESSLEELLDTYTSKPGEFHDDRGVLRAIHYYEEIKRVREAKVALNNGDIPSFLKAINESGESSLRTLQNGYDVEEPTEQKVPLTLELISQFMKKNFPDAQYGLRLHGGGFGGTITLYAPKEAADAVVSYINGMHEKGAPATAEILQMRDRGMVDLTHRASLVREEEEIRSFPTFLVRGQSANQFEPQAWTVKGGDLHMTVSNIGASIMKLECPDKDGTIENVVLGYDRPRDYEENPFYLGATIGRCANRIAGGNYRKYIDNVPKVFHLPQNDGTNHLHGGPGGFHSKPWTLLEKDESTLRFLLESPHLEMGYPGDLTVLAEMQLTPKNELIITYTASVEGFPTIVNLTNHSYFNLNGRHETVAKNGTVHNHLLELNACLYTPNGLDQVPTGEMVNVDEFPDYNFMEPRALGELFSKGNGLDVNFVVDGEAGVLRPAAKLIHPTNGRILEVETTCPGIQVYTGNFLGKDAHKLWSKHGGICLETQAFPDAIHQSWSDSVILRPGEIYREQTIYRLGVQS